MNGQAVNVMLVEDDEVDVMNIQRAFHKASITDTLYRAGDGVEALELLREGSLPMSRLLILLDLNLPRMNGLEFLHELRGDSSLQRMVVVVLTTSNDAHDKAQAFEMNVAGYLLKPTTSGTFVGLVSTLNKYWAQAEMP